MARSKRYGSPVTGIRSFTATVASRVSTSATPRSASTPSSQITRMRISRTAIRASGSLSPGRCLPRPRHSTSRSSRILSSPGRFLSASRASGGRRIGAGTRRFWRRTALSSPPAGNQPGCGDFVQIGNGVPSTDADIVGYGAIAPGALLRQLSGVQPIPGTMWAATSTGRVFFSSNADAAAGSVVWERLDSSSSVDPNRFVSGITIDPANPNHAWIVYSSYSSLTSATPGHVLM